MSLTKDQAAIVAAFKPLVGGLLKEMLKPSNGSRSLSAEKTFIRGHKCKAVTTIKDGGGDDRYRLFVELSDLSKGNPVTFDRADEAVLVAELKKAAEAVGWLWVMGANLTPGTFGILVTPRA